MNIVVDDEADDEGDKDAKEKGGFMGIQVAMLQGKELPRNRAYFDNCSTITAFNTDMYIHNIKTRKKGIMVNCNAGSIKTNRKGEYGRVDAWYMPKGIANILSMNEIEKLHRITYYSIDVYYVFHTDKGPV